MLAPGLPGLVGRDVRQGRATPGRTGSGGGGIGRGDRIGEPLLDRRPVSVARSARGHREGRRVVLRRGGGGRAATAGEVVRASGGDELESAVGPAREEKG